MYINVSNIGQKQVHAVDGFPFPWKISKEKVKEKMKQKNFKDLLYASLVLGSTMEYYSAIKQNEIMPFAATWMELEIIMLSEISQTEKDKYRKICGI